MISVCKNGPDKDVVLRGLNVDRITEDFNEQLAGCTVIEGSLIISLGEDEIDAMTQEQKQKFDDMSFPELREVTDYVLLYQTNKIKTLAHLFPNLAVIRGNHLFKVREQRFAVAALYFIYVLNINGIQTGLCSDNLPNGRHGRGWTDRADPDFARRSPYREKSEALLRARYS